MRKTALLAFAAGTIVLSGCETYDNDYGHHGGPVYSGQDYDRRGNDCASFQGDGAALLDPWLACTDEGRNIVRDGFNRQGSSVSEQTADRANVWFRRHADTDCDGRLTDPEIKAALVNAARFRRAG